MDSSNQKVDSVEVSASVNNVGASVDPQAFGENTSYAAAQYPADFVSGNGMEMMGYQGFANPYMSMVKQQVWLILNDF